ncbi:ATP-binding protein [Glycocaulis sp.]|uniref:ATP-binding protein n=1 Tax=Glycocaulis sp. TaxID=1969725 RepID=UPI0025C2289A|nr:ATP-binding protein [Glycocaulis sp.]MCH8522620.1 ATP-binding protein [Glycocaulis sp.]
MELSKLKFGDEAISDLFGNESAEHEPLEKLQQYFYKNDAFERFIADRPLRVLVGPKGTGKSAIIRYAAKIAEENKRAYFHFDTKYWPDKIEDGTEIDHTKLWIESIYKFIVSKFDLKDHIDINSDNISRFTGRVIPLISKFIANNDDVRVAASQFIEQEIINSVVKNKIVEIAIDNVDTIWAGQRGDLNYIKGLMRAAFMLSSEESGLKIKVALRSDVYYALLGELDIIDKIENSIIKMRWDNHEVLCITAARIASYFDQEFDWKIALESMNDYSQDYIFKSYYMSVFEERYKGQGKWADISMRVALMSFVRQRPRDMILLCSSAARDAKHAPISGDNIQNILGSYCRGRVNDLVTEYKVSFRIYMI